MLNRIIISRIGIVMLISILLLMWFGYSYFGTARFLPEPDTRINAILNDDDWPMVYHDPSHSGSSADGNQLLGSIRWRNHIGSGIFAAPAIVAGSVYATTVDGRLVVLDGATGQKTWEYNTGSRIFSSVAIAGDLIFVTTEDGRVIAIDSTDGTERWMFDTYATVISSPVVYDGIIYVGTESNDLYALDAATGVERWKHSVGGRISSDPVVNDDVVSVTAGDRRVYVLGVKTGKIQLDYLTNGVSGSPSLGGTSLYVGDTAGILRAIDWRQRTLPFEKSLRWIKIQFWAWGLIDSLPYQKGLKWSFIDRDELFVGAPVWNEERVFATSRSGEIFAIDRETGELEWIFETGELLVDSPCLAGGVLYVGDLGGTVNAIDVGHGEVIWELDVGVPITSHPVFGGSTLYLTSETGYIIAVD